MSEEIVETPEEVATRVAAHRAEVEARRAADVARANARLAEVQAKQEARITAAFDRRFGVADAVDTLVVEAEGAVEGEGLGAEKRARVIAAIGESEHRVDEVSLGILVERAVARHNGAAGIFVAK